MRNNIKLIALYLPQFHPTAENDLWWGIGFTEWTNVTRAMPLFKDHYQPHLPTDLGFYDLRLAESRNEQADLAREYGISGFCYYHYWFKGKRLLNRPIDDVLALGTPDFPFMLCWANETWSRRWLGEEKNILIKQEYSEEDDIEHATWLCKNVFSDPRYIKVNNRPVFVIYRPNDLPDQTKTIQTIRQIALNHDLSEPYFIGSNSHTQNLAGFDNVLNFEPQLGLLPDAFNDSPNEEKRLRNEKLGIRSRSLKAYDYEETKKLMASRQFAYDYLPCVFVGWDNTARRGKNAIIITNQSKEQFKVSLRRAKTQVEGLRPEEQIIFINAWNEWAEGNHLEPCVKYGHQFLEAVKEVFIDEY